MKGTSVLFIRIHREKLLTVYNIHGFYVNLQLIIKWTDCR